MDLTKVAIDPIKENNGVWIEIDSETSLCIARMYNKSFNRQFEKLSAPYRSSVKRGIVDEEKASEILSKVIARTVLLDWKGLKLDGKPIKYSSSQAEKILLDPKYVTFRQLVMDIADEQSNFRNEEIEEDRKK